MVRHLLLIEQAQAQAQAHALPFFAIAGAPPRAPRPGARARCPTVWWRAALRATLPRREAENAEKGQN